MNYFKRLKLAGHVIAMTIIGLVVAPVSAIVSVIGGAAEAIREISQDEVSEGDAIQLADYPQFVYNAWHLCQR